MRSEKIIVRDNSLDDLDIPIFIKNNEGFYIYCNKAFVDFLGIPKKKILGNTVYDVAPKKLAGTCVATDRALLEPASQQRHESNVQTNSTIETKITFSKSIIYDSNYDIAGFIGAVDAGSAIAQNGSDLKQLTPREIQILGLLTKGKSVKGIGRTLAISPHTVTHHLKSIYLKLDAHSKSEAVFKALTLLKTRTQKFLC
ncbi:helix-turn-helix transcriptional regulator [Polynucleobacter sp. es-MAR-4]|uniref:helix-turn-helix transcriptional regulator n=1 Tax=Polynucleobacter sp. es-MAR-4 TaxID=1855655 RepID=UPI001C0DAB50|nr:helix-turn-helix transcriptional regulator [Polynucleobacter sp. es-MAR-4]MBU3637920.1 PAS domain-containing protein [Polynucleobacter sp. es-MAR-4]